jgi:hypothetical protein
VEKAKAESEKRSKQVVQARADTDEFFADRTAKSQAKAKQNKFRF